MAKNIRLTASYESGAGATMNLADTISSGLKQKDQNLWFVPPEAPVYHAKELMAEKHIGALLVISDEKLVGILSQRDYARRIILRGKSPQIIQVKEIMHTPVIFVGPDHTVGNCLRIMTEQHIRHLPVPEKEKVLGVMSIGDLVKWIISAHEKAIHQLEHYITGAYPG